MQGVYHRCHRYWAKVMIEGKVHHATFDTSEEAQAWRQRIKADHLRKLKEERRK